MRERAGRRYQLGGVARCPVSRSQLPDPIAVFSSPVSGDLAREVFEAAGGLGWQSEALTDRDRSIAVIAALVAQNVTDARLSNYLALARQNGVDQQGLTALMVLLTAYVGQPYASLAMETVHRSADLG